MISLKNISKYYNTNQLFSDLSINFSANKLTCLLGGSGSGKTTILRLIAGLENASNGEISINDKLLTKDNKIIVSSEKRNIGFIFQDLALWPHFTIYKNIAFGLEQKKEKNIKEKVFKMLEFFDLQEHSQKFPHQLSGGQQQLLAISRSLVLKPKILLMDEPLSNIDVKLKRKILNYIKEIKQKFDLTIIYVTHDHKEAFAIADEIIVLNNGKIEEKGNVEQIKNSKNEYVKYFIEY